MNFFHKIAIDRLHPNYISGWCYHRFDKKKAVTLCLRHSGKVISRTTADMFREDLFELGLHPTGRCGFEIRIDPAAVLSETGVFLLTPINSTRPLALFSPDLSTRIGNTGIWKSFKLLLPLRSVSGPRLLFMHIPKTAGTSFNTQVAKMFNRNKIGTHIELEDRTSYPLLARKKKYLSGHLRYGIFKNYFCAGDFRLYTIVREPYAHLHSHLKWMIRTVAEDSDSYFKYSNRVIYELGKKLAAIEFGRVERIEDFVGNLSDVEAQFFDNMQTRYFCEQEIDRVTEDDFIQAVNNSKEFSLIGLTERYEQFLQQFTAHNNLSNPEKSGQLNRSVSPPLFAGDDPEIRSVLLPLVRYDLKLYDIIKKGQ